MADYMNLLGAEQVQSAGIAMRNAAEEMQRAAMEINSAMDRLARILDDHATRIEAAGLPKETGL